MYKVTSEIYGETNFQTVKSGDGKAISKFKFLYPEDDDGGAKKANLSVDKDGDLIVRRRGDSKEKKKWGTIDIEHSEATELRLVGLQVWRGALLLADYLFYLRKELGDKQILELGAGVGLTSIAAALYSRHVICTDVDIGGILDMIRSNVQRNNYLYEPVEKVEVLEYDFMKPAKNYSKELLHAIDDSDIVLAADVIYDDTLTDAFIRVIDEIFEREKVSGRKKTILVALEKRFVFTVNDVDAVAPMFEYFLQKTMTKTWRFEYVETDFPQYFAYERCKQLVLLKLTNSR